MTILPPASPGLDPAVIRAPGPWPLALLRGALIAATELVPVADWPELIDHAVQVHGASLILPDPANSWASHMAEFTAFGITGRGEDAEQALRDWCKAAMRTMEWGIEG
jgi:hypothetical protein